MKIYIQKEQKPGFTIAPLNSAYGLLLGAFVFIAGICVALFSFLKSGLSIIAIHPLIHSIIYILLVALITFFISDGGFDFFISLFPFLPFHIIDKLYCIPYILLVGGLEGFLEYVVVLVFIIGITILVLTIGTHCPWPFLRWLLYLGFFFGACFFFRDAMTDKNINLQTVSSLYSVETDSWGYSLLSHFLH